jgi:hypothetical protein
MQVKKLPAIAGFIWINAGFRLLFGHFANMVKILFTYVFVFFLFSSLVGWLSELSSRLGLPDALLKQIFLFFFVLLTPAASIGFMQACRDTVNGEPVTPLHFLRGFQGDKRTLLSLLGFGLFQFAAVSVVIASLPALPEMTFKDLVSATPPPQDSKDSLLGVLALIAYLAIAVTVWYAPMLAAWNKMRAGKAMFYSLAACWRNKGAFLMFGLGWLMVCMFLIGAVSIIAVLFGDNMVTASLLAMIGLLYAGAFYCSVYVTYSSVFVGDLEPPAA